MSDLFDNVGVAQVRLGEAVSGHLANAILSGDLKSGDVLPSEAKIAAAFGVSKQVAREAIRELAALGVVQIHQGRVSRVRELNVEPLGRIYQFAVGKDRKGLTDVTQLRRIIEPEIARMAAINADAAAKERLEHSVASMRASIGDVPRWIESDLAFHETLADICGNSFFSLQITALRGVIRQVLMIFNERKKLDPSDWSATLDRHVAIYEAVRRGDAAGAQQAMVAHFAAADTAIGELFPGLEPMARIAEPLTSGRI